MELILGGLTYSHVGPPIIDESRQIRKSDHWRKRISWVKTTPNLDDLLTSFTISGCWNQNLDYILIGAFIKNTREI